MSEPHITVSLFLRQFRSTLAVMEDSLDSADIEHLVEVGSAMSAAIASANDLLTVVKTKLRDQALQDLKHAPGAVTYKGSEEGEVTITNPEPTLQLLKDADPDILRRELGSDFDLYFESRTSYKPKKSAGERIVKLASGKQKTVLMTALHSQDGTPRVSFKKR
jgi:hypothetical protein